MKQKLKREALAKGPAIKLKSIQAIKLKKANKRVVEIIRYEFKSGKLI